MYLIAEMLVSTTVAVVLAGSFIAFQEMVHDIYQMVRSDLFQKNNA